MNTITLEEILNKYKEILDSKITREEAESFANKLMKAEDNYNLVYIPKSDEKIIWDEIIFLSMIDSQYKEPQDGVKYYMYQEEDIKNHIKKIANK